MASACKRQATLRDWVPDKIGETTYGDIWRTVTQVVQWLVADAAVDTQRWKQLLERARLLADNDFDSVMGAFEHLQPEQFERHDRLLIWDALRHQTALCRRDTGKGRDTAPIVERLTRSRDLFQPTAVSDSSMWLFSHDAVFEIGDDESDWRVNEARLAPLRKDAVMSIWQQSGLKGIQGFRCQCGDASGHRLESR